MNPKGSLLLSKILEKIYVLKVPVPHPSLLAVLQLLIRADAWFSDGWWWLGEPHPLSYILSAGGVNVPNQNDWWAVS